MPLFPPRAPVTVVIDGRPVAAYVRAYVAGGRVFAPVDPLLTRLADRLWFDDDALIVERGGRRVRIRLPRGPAPFNATYIPAGPVLRALGVTVHYDAAALRLSVSAPARPLVASPTPYNSTEPAVSPTAVFTPSPPPVPHPTWSGSPMPRRTALPFPPR